jgi:hypothetical protein
MPRFQFYFSVRLIRSHCVASCIKQQELATRELVGFNEKEQRASCLRDVAAAFQRCSAASPIQSITSRRDCRWRRRRRCSMQLCRRERFAAAAARAEVMNMHRLGLGGPCGGGCQVSIGSRPAGASTQLQRHLRSPLASAAASKPRGESS